MLSVVAFRPLQVPSWKKRAVIPCSCLSEWRDLMESGLKPMFIKGPFDDQPCKTLDDTLSFLLFPLARKSSEELDKFDLRSQNNRTKHSSQPPQGTPTRLYRTAAHTAQHSRTLYSASRSLTTSVDPAFDAGESSNLTCTPSNSGLAACSSLHYWVHSVLHHDACQLG